MLGACIVRNVREVIMREVYTVREVSMRGVCTVRKVREVIMCGVSDEITGIDYLPLR